MSSSEEGAVYNAIRSRKSVRAFLPNNIPSELILELLELGARAPSGTNIQPWQAFVVRRDIIAEISNSIKQSGISPERADWDDYKYYPQVLTEPFLGRRRTLGEDLYSSLGISRRDIAARRTQFMRNYDFFGAPVGIFFSISRHLETGSYIDLGMMMQNIMIAARAVGLHTCPQAAFAPFHRIIRPIIGLPSDQVLVCAMAVGFEDVADPVNQVKTDRIPMEDWVTLVSKKRSE